MIWFSYDPYLNNVDGQGRVMGLLADQFYAGLYSDIITRYIDSAAPEKLSGSDALFVVGSLCFLSRSGEARSLLERCSDRMSLRESVEARYYLVTALRRERRSESSAHARKILISIFKDVRRNRTDDLTDEESRFFLYCGMAFYRYTDGRFQLSLKWAQRAYDHAFRARFPFGRLVSYDLMGHSQLNAGDIRAGLKNISNSAVISEALGRGAVNQSIEVSRRLYRSTFGLDTGCVLMDELTGAIRACSFENSYTLASLYIELARLQLLIGDGHLAESSLRDAGEWVYRLDLPFMDANLSFRYAHLACLQGNFKKSLELVRSARARVTEAHDHSMEIRILGLEARILRLMGAESDADALTAGIRKLEALSGHVISRRINARLGIGGAGPIKRGEDALGDLMDEMRFETNDARARVLNSGFLGLVPAMINLTPFCDAIVFGFVNESVTFMSKGHVRHDPDGWPDLVRKLFMGLAEKRQMSKEEIAERVWRQPYRTARHDPLIYALVARARKMLEPYTHWLTVGDGAYILEPSLIVRDVSVKRVSESTNSDVRADIFSRHPGLSLRQAKIMELCETRTTVANKDLCELFAVSEVTAGRDLSDLVDKGLVRRIGKGRATSYTKR